ncbi:hypothetical protein P171DRAFT_219441 [Karstenula rhodostoma CBS 690.94]|uniref:Uncharacterized protein n=1 Tax=Karstenula rhodostoma CBS 690.94 TaxID=1392251 RepID=A0A9P4PT51_9PLEO|nr:hypothetical protein P171DRAFT_219441 [Karstenula rhodostoma CBS 690.94]
MESRHHKRQSDRCGRLLQARLRLCYPQGTRYEPAAIGSISLLICADSIIGCVKRLARYLARKFAPCIAALSRRTATAVIISPVEWHGDNSRKLDPVRKTRRQDGRRSTNPHVLSSALDLPIMIAAARKPTTAWQALRAVGLILQQRYVPQSMGWRGILRRGTSEPSSSTGYCPQFLRFNVWWMLPLYLQWREELRRPHREGAWCSVDRA